MPVDDDDHLPGDAGSFVGERRHQDLLPDLQQVRDHVHQRCRLHTH